MRICALLTIFAYLSPNFSFAADKKAEPRSAYNLTDEVVEAKGSEYVMRRYPGEKLIAVRILSGVKSPGIYYLPEGTDLLTAVSLAGGLTTTADAAAVHWNHWATQKYQQLDLDKAVEDPKTRNPVLGTNDVLMVDETRPFISNNTVLVLTVVGSLLGIIIGAKALTK